MTTILKVLIGLVLVFTLVTVQDAPIQSEEVPQEEQEWQEEPEEPEEPVESEVPEESQTLMDLEESYGTTSDDYITRIDELTGGQFYLDSWGQLVPDPNYIPQPDFGTLPANSLFLPGWVTEDGNYMLGSVAVVKVNDDLPYLGLTAFHCFNVMREIGGMDIPSYIQAGVIFDIDYPNEIVVSEVSKVWAMPDAGAWEYGKDLAAFELADVSGVNVLPLAEDTCERGEVIYLYGELVSEDEDIIETRFYPCVVMEDDGVEIKYMLSEEVDTNGASGSPLINNQGEVVGIHSGSAGSFRRGISAENIRTKIAEAYEYNK